MTNQENEEEASVYSTIEDIFLNGKKDNIDWLKVQTSFTFNSYFFQSNTFLYVPYRGFLNTDATSLTVYTFPGGNLHFLPFHLKGDFLSCKKNEYYQQCISKSDTNNNNPDHTIDLIRTNADNENPLSNGLDHEVNFNEDLNDSIEDDGDNTSSVKVFKPFLNKHGYTVARSDAKDAMAAMKKCNRFSLFSDKEYVSMASFVSFERMCNTHAKVNKDLTEEDYLEMTHPIINSNIFSNTEEMFQVKLRKRSKSVALQSSIKYKENIKRLSRIEDIGVVKKASLKHSKSINDIVGAESEEDILNPKSKKLSLDSIKKIKIDRKRDKSIKSMTLYDRLMNEVDELLKNNDILQYNESFLIERMGFNRFESRLIYYSLRGWQPNLKKMQSNKSNNRFLEDYSVSELSIFIKSIGSERLSEYLKKYNVDGYLMKLLVTDDLLLDEMLFDESFLTIEKLVEIRRAYFPKRPRCNALQANDVEKNKNGGGEIVTI